MSFLPSLPRIGRPGFLLAGLFLLALVLRLWAIDFGLPYDLTADEPHHIVQALKIGAGEGGPLVRMWHTVGKSGLDTILFAEYALLFAFWWVTGRVDTPEDFALQYLVDPSAFYLAGRVTVAVLGASTCLLVFAAGRRMYGPRVGLGAAALAAVSYYHAAASHIINVHVPMTFALAASLAAFVAYEDTRRRRWLLLAGALSGAAIALAYTAAIGPLIVLAALLSAPGRPRSGAVRDAALFGTATLVLVAVMSPDLLTQSGQLLHNFVASAPASAGLSDPEDPPAELRGAIDSVTFLRAPEGLAYLAILIKRYNVALTAAVIAAIAIGVWRRERWTLILAGAVALAVAILSLSSRGASELYLFSSLPAMWLLAGRAAAAGRTAAAVAVVLAIAAIPFTFTIRDNVMLAQPDTRLVAKAWIEAHVPSGSKILMDGMRFRFLQSPPLNPDRETAARRLADLASSELELPRDLLPLYQVAAERIPEPRYNLHSTMYGLDVRELDYYVDGGFDYIVVSSLHQKRYVTEEAIQRYPVSARFYRDLETDRRFRAVYHIEAVPWQRNGPTLTVYKVAREATAAEGEAL